MRINSFDSKGYQIVIDNRLTPTQRTVLDDITAGCTYQLDTLYTLWRLAPTGDRTADRLGSTLTSPLKRGVLRLASERTADGYLNYRLAPDNNIQN